MFGSKPLTIYITSSYLDIFDFNIHKSYHYEFPKELVQHGEIVDEVKFKDALSQFLNPLVIKSKKTFLILSQDLVFSGQIDTKTTNLDTFLEAVPISSEDRAVVASINKNIEYIFTANKKLYTVIIDTLRQKAIDTNSVVPLQAFKHKPMSQLVNSDDVKAFLHEEDVFKKYNFLSQVETVKENKKPDLEESLEKPKDLKKQYILLVICLICFAISIVLLLFYLQIIKNPWFENSSTSEQVKKITPKTAIVISPSPTLKPISKDSLSIQILNGSGVEGQASKLKDQIESLGFSKIETGNAPGAPSNTTIVVFSNRVPDVYQNEVLEQLNKNFTTIDTQHVASQSAFDIFITTGEGTK